jgi:hypothetical protein
MQSLEVKTWTLISDSIEFVQQAVGFFVLPIVLYLVCEIQLGSSPVIKVTDFVSMNIAGNNQQDVSKAMEQRALGRIELSNESLRDWLKNKISVEICRYNAVTN